MWYRQGQEKHFLAVSVGFAEVLPDRVTVLAQVAERAEDLDEARAEAGHGAGRGNAAGVAAWRWTSNVRALRCCRRSSSCRASRRGR